MAAGYSSGSKKAKAARQRRVNKNLKNRKEEKMTTAVMDALEDDDTTKVFGRVIKLLGGIHLQVYLSDGTQHNAVLRGLLRKRSHTPIEAGSVVMLERPDPTIKSEQVLEVQAVIDYESTVLLAQNGNIPMWMLTLGFGQTPPEGGVDEDSHFGINYSAAILETNSDGKLKVRDGSKLAQTLADRFLPQSTGSSGGGAGGGSDVEELGEMTPEEMEAFIETI